MGYIGPMTDRAEETAKKLNREAKRAQSRTSRTWRWFIFSLGFAQCRHCVHCDLKGRSKYRGIRESIIPGEGACRWHETKPSDNLNHDDLKHIHRCPGFEQILYNFKDYGFPADEIARIKERRWRLFITWMGWLVAVAIAITGWILDAWHNDS